MKNLLMRSLVLGAALSAASAAHAAVIQTPVVETLAQVLADNTPITVGNATYSGFVLNGSTIPASNITVTISQNASTSSIVLTPNTPWASGNPNGATQIQWLVTFAAPVNNVGLSFVATGAPGSIASVGETAINESTGQHYSLQVATDGIGALPDNLTASMALAPAAASLGILKSIDIAGSGSATITSVTNTYSTPEPASLGMLSVAGVALLRRRRKA